MTQLDRRTLFKLLAAGTGTMALGERMALSQAMSSDKTLCEHLAQYVVGLRFASIPHEVVSKAKDVILHNLAVAFGGVGTDQYNKAVEFVGQRRGTATIIGQSFKVPAADAAFVNTIAIRALRMEDNMEPSGTHPGACLVPTALSIAEQNGTSGPEMLAAVIAGYDVVGKIATSISPDTGRSPSHIFGAIGVAATAAKMMRFDVEQTAGALAHACNLGALITEGFQDFQYGVITRNGLFAAELARLRTPFPRDALEGQSGFYAVQLGGQRPTTEQVIGTLGTRYEILSTILKPYPCTGANLVPIEMMRALARKHKLTDDNVRRIRVVRDDSLRRTGGLAAVGPFTGYLGGRFQASSSLPFALAVTLVDGEITLAHFDNPNNPRFVPAMHKVAVEFREGLGSVENEISIERTDGTTVSLKGGAEYFPKSNERELLGHLEFFGRPKVGEAKVTELARRVAALDRAPEVASLARCLS